MLLLLKNYVPLPSAPLLMVPLPHFLTLVFSSSPSLRLPQSQEFAVGQKAAAEAQPIWNAAPPSWRSKREEGPRLVVKQATSCLYAQPTCSACLHLLDHNWQLHSPVIKYACMREPDMSISYTLWFSSSKGALHQFYT